MNTTQRIAAAAGLAGGVLAGMLGLAGAAQAEAPADYGRAGHAPAFDRYYDDDDRYYGGDRYRYDAPYHGRLDGPTFSISPNGVVFGFPI